MPRREFQGRLDALRAAVVELGEAVLDRLETALGALDRRDPGAVAAVADGDGEINRRHLAVEAECIELLATQHPVAGDLRFVVASLKIATDLERVGDLAQNLAEYAREAERYVAPDVEVREIGWLAADQLRAALRAYADGDAAATYGIADRDDEIDRLCAEAGDTVVRGLVARDTDPEELDALMSDVRRLLLTVRDVERVGDHAVNVAARTLYMVEGEDELVE